jgi:hypothetical protein
LLVALFLAAGCQRAAPPAANVAGLVTVEQEGVSYHLTGPFSHENLSVFLIHAPTQDEREFITLDQGLKDGLVKITEKAEEQVGELRIDNRSDYPLFLQEGDRLTGGKQDRTIYASLVVPPKSGPMVVPTFCIEQGRWSQGKRGPAFESPTNVALAPKPTREAAKFSKSQDKVWESVRVQKQKAAQAKLAGNSNSSLNETFDSPEVTKLSSSFAKALADVLHDRTDAVGVAVVVNGTIEEVNVYPNHALLCKLYPRLLQSYALQATLEKEKAKDAPAVSVEEVAKFMAEGKAKAQREEKINRDNRLVVIDRSDDTACAKTQYQGAVVHQQILKRSAPSGEPAVSGDARNPFNRQPAPRP